MKKAKDEQFYLVVPNPFTGDEVEFDLDNKAHVGIAMRLIRKRERLIEKSQSEFDKMESLRDKHGVDKIETKVSDISERLKELDESDQEGFEKLKKEMEDIQDQYPQELVDLQESVTGISRDIDDVGIKFCMLVLNPVNEIPDEYESKKELIEELIPGEDIPNVIAFFLSILDSTLISQRESGIKMKSREKEGE